MNRCCICETNRYSKKFRRIDGYHLLRCSNCGLIYLDGAADSSKFIEDARGDLFNTDKNIEYWGFPEIYNRHSLIFKGFFKERLMRCFKYKKDISSMFDIGCGYGFWMDYCRQAGMKVKGIDLSLEAINYCKKTLQLDADMAFLSDFNFDDKYDLYNFCDVLEHLEDPNRELKILHNIMSPGALLYIQVPDVFGVKIPYGHNLGLPHHVWQFNFKTLMQLLNKHGFLVLSKWHGIQGIVGAYMRHEVSIFTKAKWFIARNLGLGNRLMIVCKKAS